MASEFGPNDNAGKILAIFAIIFISFIIFLSGITNVATSSIYAYNYTKKRIDTPLRGTIYSRDGRVLSRSFHKYDLALNGIHIEPGKMEELSEVLAVYTGLDEAVVLRQIRKLKRVVLLEGFDESLAQDLRYLTRKLDSMGFFKTLHVNGRDIRRGLDIIKKREVFREYPFDDMLEPVLGYFNRGEGKGTIGLENSYEHILAENKKGIVRAERDVSGHMILNKNADRSRKVDGSDIVLTINSLLQKDMEALLDRYKTQLEAQEILGVIMDSRTGDLYAVASSNRYNAEHLSSQEVRYMKVNAIQYLFEPGSVIKPFVVAKLIEEKLVGVYDLVRGYNGRYKLGRKMITDSHPKEWFSVEEAVYHSSNIALSQLSQKLSPYRFNEMMEQFGFSERSGVDLSYESVGRMLGISQLKDPLVRATASYGYGFAVNLMQLMKAFNVFNNDGKMIEPKLARKVAMGRNKVLDIGRNERLAISQVTALKMKKILRKTVNKGTAVNAQVAGVYTAGKTGTAHIAKEGKYEDLYHSSFLGFANEMGGDRRYTIGVLVINPKTDYFASKTATPIFKETVEMMLKRGWIRSENNEKTAGL